MTFYSDSIVGGKPHSRAYGSTVKIPGRYVWKEDVISLPEAIRKMTSAPAARLGLQRRGLIREGDDRGFNGLFSGGDIEDRDLQRPG